MINDDDDYGCRSFRLLFLIEFFFISQISHKNLRPLNYFLTEMIFDALLFLAAGRGGEGMRSAFAHFQDGD